VATRSRVPDDEKARAGSRATTVNPDPARALASRIGNRSFRQLSRQLLEAEHVSRHDDLFERGGGYRLWAAVGRGAPNYEHDVEIVKNRLAALGYPSGGPNEPALADAIAAYQAESLHFKRPDGRVDPGGRTLAALYDGKTARGLDPGPSPKPDPTPVPKPDPKPTPTPSGGWVEGQWSDPDFKGEQQASVTEITKQQLYAEIGRVAPRLSHTLKTCLVGHAWVEQRGKGVLNWNFAGVEGGGSPAYVMGWTSDVIPTSTYENEPDKSKYRDWDWKNHNPKFGRYDGHDAGTIDYQLALQPKPSRIVVLVRKRRPAYQSLSHAAAAFVGLIERRVEALRASTNPDHNKLAESAFAGDADAYANIVNHKFQIRDATGKKRDFGAYNGDKGYAGLVKTQIAAARADLPG
jgi:hypothetical protein